MFAFSSPSSLGRMLPSRPLAKRFLLASTLSLLILPLGCNATGASVADWQTASSETFLSKEQMERGRYSLQAELTFAQLKLSKALMSDDHDAVLEAANSLLATSPRGGVFSASAVVDAAIWLLAHEHEEEAMELVERSSAIMPEELPLIALWADLLIQQNEREKAIGILESFAGRHPDDAQAQAELALALLRSARAEDAMSVFKKIPADKLTPQIRFSYAQALSAERRFQEAEKQLSAAVEEDPEYSEAWQLLALTLEEQGRAREAMTIYTRLLGEDPDNRSARLFLLRYHLRSGNTENAISVVAESQDPLRFAVAASAILLEEKQYAQAESLMSSLTRLPDMPADLYFYYAALLYEGGGDLDRALQFLTLVPADGEEHDKVLRLRVRILCELKRFPEAVSALRELLQVHPDDFESTMLLAELLIRQENFEEAGSLLTKVVAAQPDNENALLQQALLKEMQGKRDEAMVLMEKLIVKFPENAMALNFIGYNLADRGVELDRALDLIQRALESEPDADFIVDSLAWAHFRRGELDLAWKHIQQAVSLANQKGNVDPAMIEHLGDIAKARGDRGRAKQAWQQAMEVFLKFNFKDDAARVREKLKKVQP